MHKPGQSKNARSVRANWVKPEKRYLNLDLSNYGAHGIGKILSMPSLQSGVLLGLFSAAADALARTAEHRIPTFIPDFAVNTLTLACAQSLISVAYGQFSAKNKNVVIDKKGEAGDPEMALLISESYKKARLFKPEILLISVLYAATGNLMGIPLYLTFITPALWFRFAAYKLDKGEWTARTNLPEAAHQKVSQGLYPELQPVRTKQPPSRSFTIDPNL